MIDLYNNKYDRQILKDNISRIKRSKINLEKHVF